MSCLRSVLGKNSSRFPHVFRSFSAAPSRAVAVPIELIKSLRAQTGAPITAIKSALVDHDLDPELALDALRKRGAELSSKRAERVTQEGLIGAAVSPCRTIGALVELRCETDFVARNDRFNLVLEDLCQSALGLPAGNIAEALQNDAGTTAALADAAGALGEGIKIGSARVLAPGDGARISAYAHGGANAGRIAALVALRGAPVDVAPEVGIRLAMHVAAAAPLVVQRESLSPVDVERERFVLRDAAIEQGKQGVVVDKIVDGRMQKWYRETCLVEQEMLVERPEYEGKARSVAQSLRVDAGEATTVSGFERFAIS